MCQKLHVAVNTWLNSSFYTNTYIHDIVYTVVRKNVHILCLFLQTLAKWTSFNILSLPHSQMSCRKKYRLRSSNSHEICYRITLVRLNVKLHAIFNYSSIRLAK